MNKIDAFMWQRVQEFASRKKIVTAGDMQTRFGIHTVTAKKYLALLVETHGWQWVKGIRRPGSRGPAPKTIGRIGVNNEPTTISAPND